MPKLLLLLLLTPLLSMCQPLSLTGKLLTEEGQPIEGATITVHRPQTPDPKPQTPNPSTLIRQLSSGANGGFTLSSLHIGDTVTITAVGYVTEIVVIDQSHARFPALTLVLKKRTAALDEVLIMAYGTTTRRLSTGNISKVSAADIARQPVQNPLAALEGRVAGLTVVQSSGLPGAAVRLQLRGQSSITQGSEPLFIIDGVPFAPNNGNVNRLTSLLTTGGGGLSPFSAINPADIESIEVLKDADATAIYGSRGAAGVVLITTKRGRAGESRFSVNFSQGFSRLTRRPAMLSTPQYLQMRREAFASDGLTPTAANAYDLLAWDTTRYTDFSQLLLGGTAALSTAGASLSGGSGGTTYLLGGTWSRETTVFPGAMHNTRGGLSASITHAPLGKRFSTSFTASYTANTTNLVAAGLTNFISLPPNAPPLYTPGGGLNWEEGGYAFTNPLAYLERTYQARNGSLVSRLQASYTLLPGLSLLASAGYNSMRVEEESLTPKRAQNGANNPTGTSQFGSSHFESWILEPQLRYTLTAGSSVVEALAGSSFQQSVTTGLTIGGTGYTNDALLRSLAAAPAISPRSRNFADYRYTAVFGRVTYRFREQYLLNLSGRRDGSSRFGPGRQFANFGALGAAWIFSAAKGLQQRLPFLSFGKLRASWGTTGNDQIGDYRYLDAWSLAQPYAGNMALYPASLFNPAYGWEISKKLEAAVELGFLQNRVHLSAAWFRNRSSNQLVEYILPSQTGFFSIISNLPALVQNKGWEGELTTTNIQTARLQWTTTFNITLPENKLLAFPGLASSAYASTYRLGQPLSVIYKYRFTGVDRTTGLFTFNDYNRDGFVVPPADYQESGHLAPVFFGGLGNTLRWKGWEAHLFFVFKKQKGANYLATLYAEGIIPGSLNNQPLEVWDRWQKPGDETNVQRFTASTTSPAYNAANLFRSSDGGYSDASFARLKTATLSWNLPTPKKRQKGRPEGRVYLQAQNLLTFTGYQGADPETQNFYALPPLRTIAAGVQLTF